MPLPFTFDWSYKNFHSTHSKWNLERKSIASYIITTLSQNVLQHWIITPYSVLYMSIMVMLLAGTIDMHRIITVNHKNLLRSKKKRNRYKDFLHCLCISNHIILMSSVRLAFLFTSPTSSCIPRDRGNLILTREGLICILHWLPACLRLMLKWNSIKRVKSQDDSMHLYMYVHDYQCDGVDFMWIVFVEHASIMVHEL